MEDMVEPLDANTSLDAADFDSALSFLDTMDFVSPSDDALLDEITLGALSELSTDMACVNPVHVSQATALEPAVSASSGAVRDDDDDGGERGPHDGRAQSDHSPKKTKATMKSKMWRDRKKEEKALLLAQVEALEAELAELKTSSRSSKPTAWMKLAKRQDGAKRKALVENLWLRELLDGHLRAARNLERVLSKRTLCGVDDGFAERKRPRVPRLLAVGTSMEEIHGRIHSQFSYVDAVISDAGLSDVYTDMDDPHVSTRATADGAICIELKIVKVYPFTVEQVVDALWQCLSAERVQIDNGHFGGSQRSEDTCDLSFAVEVKDSPQAVLLYHVHGVAARRSEPERSLLVCETFGEAEGGVFSQDPIFCRERRYLTIEKNPTGGDTCGSPSTIMRMCSCTWPGSGQGSWYVADHSLFVESGINFFTNSDKGTTQTILQLVENALVEQALK